ncbi:hypothetical protein G7B40_041060 [Aetokthonos hydrillicola Thurmond2011]|jgi:hypothetical protein|uniref:Uncharacterized protein n=1 Tax=Aetokthonos hydrillicola Thurmond2011 TaxID=2712845 RepID=A0AAP5IGS7_9CYAN|nr:hypothetical protein [Aetokthonos hydrillicola]MBO3463021.1 hypothetical protein [Aetokthonos hydrillicola CCALA 1050]MBW4590838.1 hypothetical protein [Aetokthonos hydrillicola CCALA 1050]MDR9900877.1 hypothetical protein [Aetokthonos hydrillicola Thurmond2011]
MKAQATTTKLKDIKNRAIALAKSLGLTLTQTKHFKKHVGQGLDLRTKRGWLILCDRLNQLAGGVVVRLLKQSALAA